MQRKHTSTGHQRYKFNFSVLVILKRFDSEKFDHSPHCPLHAVICVCVMKLVERAKKFECVRKHVSVIMNKLEGKDLICSTYKLNVFIYTFNEFAHVSFENIFVMYTLFPIKPYVVESSCSS